MEKGPTDEEDAEPVAEQGPVGNLSDLIADSKIWQLGGIGFGGQDTMLLQKSLKTLMAKNGSS